MPYSLATVSSTSRITLQNSDHMTRSDRCDDATTFLGNWSRLSRSAMWLTASWVEPCIFSLAMDVGGANGVLQLDRTSWRLALVELQMWLVFTALNRWWRFLGQGWVFMASIAWRNFQSPYHEMNLTGSACQYHLRLIFTLLVTPLWCLKKLLPYPFKFHYHYFEEAFNQKTIAFFHTGRPNRPSWKL